MESHYCSAACQREHWKAGHKHKCVEADTPRAASGAAAAPRAFSAETAAAPAVTPRGGMAHTDHANTCAICLDDLRQPQALPCGHRFCRGCVASMRQHGVSVAQVCPLCRGPMPDVDRLLCEASALVVSFTRYRLSREEAEREGMGAIAQQMLEQMGLGSVFGSYSNLKDLAAGRAQEGLDKAAALCAEALAIDAGRADVRALLALILDAGRKHAPHLNQPATPVDRQVAREQLHRALPGAMRQHMSVNGALKALAENEAEQAAETAALHAKVDAAASVE
jgi:hypothetical protein